MNISQMSQVPLTVSYSFTDFLQYAYGSHFSMFLCAVLCGIILGFVVSFRQNQRRKTGNVLFCMILSIVIFYPVFSSFGYFEQAQWRAQDAVQQKIKQDTADKIKLECATHKEYIMAHNMCWKKVEVGTYIPVTSWTINSEVGDAVRATDGK